MNRGFVGFDRYVERAWLESALGLAAVCATEQEFRAQLDVELEPAITGVESRRKTVRLLARVWFPKRSHTQMRARDEALDLAPDAHSQDRLALHWGLLSMTYPFFVEVCEATGRLGRLHGTVTVDAIRTRLVETWGNRSTVKRATERALQSMAEWGVIEFDERAGGSQLAAAKTIESPDIASWLLHIVLISSSNGAHVLSDVVRLPQLFPFVLDRGLEMIRRSPKFEVFRDGSALNVVQAVEEGY